MPSRIHAPHLRVLPRLVGVYSMHHSPTDSSYVGSSRRCVSNRIGWHLCKLSAGCHSCVKLQELWDSSTEDEWEVRLLEEGDPGASRERETHWMGQVSNLLNTVPSGDGAGRVHSESVRMKMSESRARYLSTPGARESLSKRASLQHQQGKLGQATWSEASRRGLHRSQHEIYARQNRERARLEIVDDEGQT